MQRTPSQSPLVRASLAVVGISAGLLAADARAAGPNIIILNINDMGIADLAPYNTDNIQADTPTANRLASQVSAEPARPEWAAPDWPV